MLERIDLGACSCKLREEGPDVHTDECQSNGNRIDWAVFGLESGPGHRPGAVGWIEDGVAQCRAAGIAAYVKQDNGPRSGMKGRIPDELWNVREYPRGGSHV